MAFDLFNYDIHIFDYDLTIADSLSQIEKSFIHAINKFQGDEKKVNICDYFGVGSQKTLLDVYEKTNPRCELATFEKELSYLGEKYCKEAELFLKDDFFAYLKKRGVKLFIISNNKVENIKPNLQRNRIDHFFEEIIAAENFGGKDKAIDKIVTDHQYDRTKVLYIGDHLQDIFDAKKAGIDVLAVATGICSFDVLKKHTPTFVIKNLYDFIPIQS